MDELVTKKKEDSMSSFFLVSVNRGVHPNPTSTIPVPLLGLTSTSIIWSRNFNWFGVILRLHG